MEDSTPWVFVLTIVGMAYIAMYFKNSKYPMALTQSTIDKEYYLVRNLPDKQDACEFIAKINVNIYTLWKGIIWILTKSA
jgi:hypothetical protein